MSHIFISYSREDADCARKITRKLQAAGYTIWQDIDKIRGGDDWKQKIRIGIRDAKVIIVIWSASARNSEWVKWELEQAIMRHQANELIIIPLNIDGTPLEAPLTRDISYIDIPQCGDAGLNQLIAALPPELRWQIASFTPNQTLEAQGAQSLKHSGGLYYLPLVKSHTCRGVIIGEKDTTAQQQETIQLALQFSRNTTLPFLAEIKETLGLSGQKVFGIYVTGHFDVVGDEYHLDDQNPAQWLEAIYTTEKAVSELVGYLERQPTIQLFCAGPVALAFAIGMKLYRFYRVEMFNYIPKQQKPPHYNLVIDSSVL